ncbi:hypothetical protein Nepgr_003788 [Nepenthes gracilis]|uniref:Uncharacterized protein n=1 Tax=Nepenthes gracilis TaxID=150966 RepID=A0AAD3XE56_NEPGR|nr:hypothetical protein Nepgr_003788 [Nepenthes gracilis]
MVYSFMPKSKNHIQDNWRIIDFLSHHLDSLYMFTLLFDDVGFPQDYSYNCSAGRDGNQRLVQGILPARDLHCGDGCDEGKDAFTPKSLGQLSGSSTILKVFNSFPSIKRNGQHHLQELTNSADLSFNAKVAVEEKHCLLAYFASVQKESAFSHFAPPVGHGQLRNPTARSGKRYHHIRCWRFNWIGMCIVEQLNNPLDLEAPQGTVNEMLPLATCLLGENCQVYTRPLLFICQLLCFWKALLHSYLANRILFLIIAQSPNVATRRSSIWKFLSGAIYRGANIGILQQKLQWEWNVGEKTSPDVWVAGIE